MLYYLGKGIKFEKEKCKEYKTLKNALVAASKNEMLNVWDENGKLIGGLTDNVPEEALKTNPDGSVPAFNESGNLIGAVDAATVATVIGEYREEQSDTESIRITETRVGEDEADTGSQSDEIIIPPGTMRVTVICDGTLNLRRSADWGNDNICGRASRGQSYYVKAIHMVQGRKMVQTIDDIYLSGQPEHVQFE